MNICTRLGRLGWLLGGLALLGMVATVLLTGDVDAADTTPQQINFQGRLTDAAGAPVTGSRDMFFRYFDVATGGTALYEESRLASNSNAVVVTQGNYAVALGGGTRFGGSKPLFKDLFTDPAISALYLELQVVGELAMTPRIRILAAGYAINADLLDGQEASAFALKAGDTMTGTLTLPANGLVIGGNQIVLSGGNVGIGTASPAATLDVGGTGAMKVPVGTIVNRPASPAAGMLRFNSDTASLEYYNGAAWLAAAARPTAPVASGGAETTIIEGGVTYKIHTFTATGTFTVTSPGLVEVLVVAGGGSGGNHSTTNGNGGGGGGGVVYQKNFAVTPQVYVVTVGAGAAAIGFSTNSRGNNGGNSIFGTLTALGGGGGGTTGLAAHGRDGGCGGGGGAVNGAWGGGQTLQLAASGNTPGYGNPGGRSYVSWTGGGGGGAGSEGNNVTIAPNSPPDGNGGRGLGCSITGALVYYAGGGGGGGNSTERGGDAYDGGGRGFGTTTYYNNLTYPVGTSPLGGSSTPDALPNTGGGGGGGSYWSNNAPQWAPNKGSGAGGSGIVIVRYWTTQ